ncbi:ftsH [Symbiodinium sp. CCMP2592]|nr:ftsH [Symbiodinium sp. CCMP2592]
MEIDSLRRGLDEVLSAQRAREELPSPPPSSELQGHRAEALAEELAGARQAVHRLEAESEGWRSQLQNLGSAMQELSRARQDQATQQEVLSRELADARASMQRMQAQSEDFQSRLQSQMQEMERMRADTQECLRENDACARERALLSQRLQEVEAGLGDVRNQPGLREHGIEIEKLKAVRVSITKLHKVVQLNPRAFTNTWKRV